MQWEFAGRLGPPPGRYVVRRYAGDEVRQVVVVSELGHAPRPERRFRSRGRRVGAGPAPSAAPVTRVTVIDAEPLADRAAGRAWLERTGDVASDAFRTLAHVVAAYRVAAADPAIADPDPDRALAARLGYGSGEQVADGAWEAARELPRPPRPRRPDTRPQERLAALLSARDAALACEELALRARGDLDCGREREAAMQLEAALAAALAELESWREQGDLAARLTELAGHREPVAAAAAAAREGRLDGAHVEAVTAALARLEAAVRARANIKGV